MDNLVYKESEKELLARAKSVTNGDDGDLICQITSDMSSEQRRSILRAAHAKAKKIVTKMESAE